jgi:glycyl-tRNA synthetase alpha chain
MSSDVSYLLLKCSHTFNLLEARGVISVTERTATIACTRHLAKQVAEAWLAERRALEFPLLSPEARKAWLAANTSATEVGN